MVKKEQKEPTQRRKKVYSPDIVVYDFEGAKGVSSTVAYVLVAPFRIVSRVMHNIFVMPANIQDEFAEGLLVVASLVSVLGLVDLVVAHKWVMLVSQLPLFPIAIGLRKRALEAVAKKGNDPIVDVDKEEVLNRAYTIWDDINKVI